MKTAKIFENGRSQAVRLPKEYRFEDDEVLINKIGDAVVLLPKSKLWDFAWGEGSTFTEDCFEELLAERSQRSAADEASDRALEDLFADEEDGE